MVEPISLAQEVFDGRFETGVGSAPENTVAVTEPTAGLPGQRTGAAFREVVSLPCEAVG
jgi:hypothetical protein